MASSASVFWIARRSSRNRAWSAYLDRCSTSTAFCRASSLNLNRLGSSAKASDSAIHRLNCSSGSRPSLSRSLFRANSRAKGPKASSLRRRSEEHTSELQSQSNLVCRLLLEKKKNDLPPDQRKTSRTDLPANS